MIMIIDLIMSTTNCES